ncbi:oxygenase MpaB family protein [Emticicia fluvialis]|uniref:oxygenase MpaB family protein n=1 Tax=Emticicia fluvialis TaxID=2974474 RepID=UPI002165707D|nr:oxygenase MpaB family protein [Emticicia fluvialis]
MNDFVDKHSIVRKIWGNSDVILFIFAGSAAEFALNKAVDWLYFTGKIPSDPMGRLFSTVRYAQMIVFAERESAIKTIDQISSIHQGVEQSRGARIPDWAYRDVLYMLIDYAVVAYELLERKLSLEEKEEVFNVFSEVGLRMDLKDLPEDYTAWQHSREAHLQADLVNGHYTADLFKQYKKHLGGTRYRILLECQKLVVPARVSELLHFGSSAKGKILLNLYLLSRKLKVDGLVKHILLPAEYSEQIHALNNGALAKAKPKTGNISHARVYHANKKLQGM